MPVHPLSSPRGLIAAFVVLAVAFLVGCDPTPLPVPGDQLDRIGSMTVTTDGAVIDHKDVAGNINIKADNVTIRNSRVTSESAYPIRQYDGFRGLKVIDTTVACTSSKGFAGVVFNDFRAQRVDVKGCKKSFPVNANVRIIDSTWNGKPVTDTTGGQPTNPPPTNPTTPPPTTPPPTTPPPTTPPPTNPPPTHPPPTNPPPTNPPPAGAFPTDATTGVPGGTALQPSGSVTVSTNGAVIDTLSVNGTITVNADNVTIRRTRVEMSAALGIRINGRNALIEDTEVFGTANSCAAAIGYGGYTARRVDVSGCADGLKVSGDVVVEDSYIHDQRKFSGAHNDAIQASSGSNILIRHNTILGPHQESNAALMFGTTLGPISNVRVENNYLAGGGYMVYFVNQDQGFGPPVNIQLINNVVESGSFKHQWLSTNAAITVAGNVYTAGGSAN